MLKVEDTVSDQLIKRTHCSLALSKLNLDSITKKVSSAVSSAEMMLTYSALPAGPKLVGECSDSN